MTKENLISLNYDGLDTHEIQRVQNVKTIIGCKEPIVITDEMGKWPGMGKWNFDYFEEKYGEISISSDRMENGGIIYRYMPLKKYVRYLHNCHDSNPFYAKTSIHLKSNLREDYIVPPIFRCWYREYNRSKNIHTKMYLSNLYMGPRYARTNLHTDIWATSFWNALFFGRKLWVFIPHDQEQYLYRGQVDPFFPDYDRFPDYKLVTPRWYVQNPGEIVFCPGKIWHSAMVLKSAIALSENIINEDDYENVREIFKMEGHTNALKKLEDIIAFQAALKDSPYQTT